MYRFVWFALPILAAAALAAPPAPPTTLVSGPLKARSYSKLAFGPDGILFVGDSIGAKIYALDLDDRKPVEIVKPLEVADVEGKIAAMLGADSRDVMIHDMAVNPISKNAYLTVSRGRRGFVSQWQLPNDVASAGVLLRVTPAGAIEEVRLESVKHSTLDISNPVNEKTEVDWKKSKQRVDAISDMVYAGGRLYVAGLSNEEFSSTMRVYPFPFQGAGSATSLEIYHGSHGKYETDSPVRAFLPFNIQGKPYLLASYLCTPLVLFPMEELKDKAHVKGTTIAELGSGNYPLDMVSFRSKGQDYVMVVNSTRGLLLFKAEDLAKPQTPITTPIEGTAGVAFEALRNQGVLQAENYGDRNLLLLARNSLNGEVILRTMPTERQ
jgi:hypothetical protein